VKVTTRGCAKEPSRFRSTFAMVLMSNYEPTVDPSRCEGGFRRLAALRMESTFARRADEHSGIQEANPDMKIKAAAGYFSSDLFHAVAPLAVLLEAYGDRIPMPRQVQEESAAVFATGPPGVVEEVPWYLKVFRAAGAAEQHLQAKDVRDLSMRALRCSQAQASAKLRAAGFILDVKTTNGRRVAKFKFPGMAEAVAVTTLLEERPQDAPVMRAFSRGAGSSA